MNGYIDIKGAKENNLKNVDLKVPRNKVVCFVGVSGSGKSTLAFDIIAREGERQYFESLSSYARRYLVKSNRPNVDEIRGVSASIVISQDRVRGNPRSTVGTMSEAYTYLRLLYSRVGLPTMDSSYFSFNHPYGACKKCKGLGRAVEVNVDRVINKNKSLNEGALLPSDWYVGGRQWSIVKASGYFDMDKKLNDYTKEELDRLLYASPEMLQSVSGEFIDHWTFQGVVHRIIHRNNNTHRGLSENDMKYFDLADCLECHGGRLNSKSLEVLINRKNIGEVANMSLIDCLNFIKTIQHKNAQVIKPRLVSQLESLVKVGVDYLSLNRSADTLSGGEAQRVKMARQLGCDLVETVYVLDEPTAGLHPRDVEGVIKNLRKLQNKGNTVIIVEHDREVINNADYLIELGPGGGKNGGKVIAQGTLNEVLRNKNSITAKYLRENIRCHSRENGNLLNKQAWSLRNSYYIDSPVKPENDKVREPADCLVIKNARLHNLKNLNVRLPLGDLIALTGVSGSGKSSLVEEILRQHQDRVGLVDQSPIGATKRGCIATYIGVFDRIRRIFSQETGMNASFFSFNSFGGCQQCKGVGFIEMDMNFLGDVKIKCENCGGKRYKENVLQYKFYGKDIAEVLNMTALDVKDFFDDFEIKRAMDMLIDVGLDYLEMGQTLDTLSGGESQRLKLASKLQSKGDFIILDEPTSGLHFADVEKLLRLLNRLVNNGNTILVVEHNLDVIKNCDWIIDLGPGGGEKGGEIVAQGKLENIIKCKKSYTGKYLQKLL